MFLLLYGGRQAGMGRAAVVTSFVRDREPAMGVSSGAGRGFLLFWGLGLERGGVVLRGLAMRLSPASGGEGVKANSNLQNIAEREDQTKTPPYPTILASLRKLNGNTEHRPSQIAQPRLPLRCSRSRSLSQNCDKTHVNTEVTSRQRLPLLSATSG